MRKHIEAQKLLRMVDANFNRAKEGLRVCEDVCRYGFDRKSLTKQLKDLRHALTSAVEMLKIKELLAARDIEADVGRASTVSELKRESLSDVFYANAQRVKESLRVLEEVTKILDPRCAKKLKSLRYKFYAVEKNMVARS